MSRAVSTVVDVGICLLLLSAAVVILVTAAPPVDGEDGEPSEAATSMATATTAVEYERADGTELTRRGTLAELLAAAAVANATIDSDGPVGEEAFVEAVQATVALELDEAVPGERIDTTRRTQVRAVWAPQRGTGIRGEVIAGHEPPADADIETETLSIPITGKRSVAEQELDRNRSAEGEPPGHRRPPSERANQTLELWVPRSAQRPLSVERSAPQATERLDRLQTLLLDRPARVDSGADHEYAQERIRDALERRYRHADRTEDTSLVRIEIVEIVVRRWTV